MSNTIDGWLEAQRIKGGSHGFECIGIARMQQVWDAAREDLEQQLAEIVEQNNDLASRVSEIRLVRDELRQQLAEAQAQSARRLEGLYKCGIEKDQLRDAMEAAWQDGYCFCGAEGLSDVQKQFQAALAATEPKPLDDSGITAEVFRPEPKP